MCKAINSKMHNFNQPQNDHHKARKCKESLRHGASIANLGELAYAQYICMLSIGKMANSMYGYKGGSARSLQWSSFRENATNILTFIAH